MHISSLSPLLFLPLTAAILPVPQPQHIFSNPPTSDYKIPSIHESAILARRILQLTPIGTLSTIFPSISSSQSNEQRPADVSGTAIGLMDYISDCEESGNPTILAISIATSFKNAASGSNISLSLFWTQPSRHTTLYSPASLPRFSLIGYLQPIYERVVEDKDIATCFTKSHPDAKYWLPGNRIHDSHWVRLVVREVYWIGGFGDRAYIGWIPVEEWRNVTREEWEGARLPGERETKGWMEWLGLGQWEL